MDTLVDSALQHRGDDTIFLIVDGKVAAKWAAADTMGLMWQLGIGSKRPEAPTWATSAGNRAAGHIRNGGR